MFFTSLTHKPQQISHMFSFSDLRTSDVFRSCVPDLSAITRIKGRLPRPVEAILQGKIDLRRKMKRALSSLLLAPSSSSCAATSGGANPLPVRLSPSLPRAALRRPKPKQTGLDR